MKNDVVATEFREKILSWLRQSRRSQAWLAREVGMSKENLNLFLKGHTERMSGAAMKSIGAVISGQVGRDSIVTIQSGAAIKTTGDITCPACHTWTVGIHRGAKASYCAHCGARFEDFESKTAKR